MYRKTLQRETPREMQKQRGAINHQARGRTNYQKRPEERNNNAHDPHKNARGLAKTLRQASEQVIDTQKTVT